MARKNNPNEIGKPGLSGTARVMLFCLLALFAFFLALGIAVLALVWPFATPLTFGLGLLLSTSISGARIVLLDRSLQKAAEMDPERAKNYGTLQMVLRHAGTLVALLPAIFFPHVFHLYGVIIGLLLLQLAAYLSSAIIKKRPDLAGLDS